ncbi:MAG: MerR family transcriptional regulator [Lachnospiraceae bacterium]|jgi:Predicted transcriptional regulators|nr:MerR family transcriptional regulator [Lachnospiraceae bacterium]
MMTVNEVSKLTGVSIRTLQYYDKINLLKPSRYTESGYRLYDDTALETLQQILLFRELEFPLKEIKEIISKPDFDRTLALEQQITLLTLKKEHLENLIEFAREIQLTGVRKMDFSVFDTKKMDEYAKQAKEKWGHTAEYKEFEQKVGNRDKEADRVIQENFMRIFAEFGRVKDSAPGDPAVQSLVKKLQDFITEHFYKCSDEMLFSLGKMYAGGGEFAANIDNYAGKGTAEFTAEAIGIYTRGQ